MLLLKSSIDYRLIRENYLVLEKELDNTEIVDIQTKVMHIKLKCYLKKLKSAKELTKQLFQEIDRISQPFEYLYILHCQGWVYYYSGEYRKAYDLLQQSLPSAFMITASQPVQNVMVAIDYMIIYGTISRIMGKAEEAKKIFEHGLHLSGAISDVVRIQALIGNMGKLQFKQGDLVQAIDRFRTASELAKEKELHKYEYMWLNGLSKILVSQGKLDEAEKAELRAYEIASDLDDLAGKIVTSIGLGLIYYRRGQVQQALEYYDMFSREEIKNDDTYAMILYYKFQLYYHIDDQNNLLRVLSEIESIRVLSNEVRINEISELIRAVYLKDRIRYRDKARAEEVLRKIVDKRHNPVDLRINMDAFLYLSEILLEQLKQSQNNSKNTKEEEKIMGQELFELASEYEKLAKKHGSHMAEIEANFLLGHLSISQLEISKAEEYFNRAHYLSDEYGIHHTHIHPPETDEMETSEFPDKNIFPLSFQKSINKVIHSLPRLNIVIFLFNSGVSQFKELQTELGFSSGNLTRHCDKLIEAGYVFKQKEFIDQKQTTTFQLTPHGYSEFQNYARMIKQYL